jgi:hypothetical protein
MRDTRAMAFMRPRVWTMLRARPCGTAFRMILLYNFGRSQNHEALIRSAHVCLHDIRC